MDTAHSVNDPTEGRGRGSSVALHDQDGLWSWVVCCSATVSIALAIGICFSYGILLPVFSEYFKESREKTAWVGSLAMCFTFLFGPVAALMVQRLGCQATTIIGSISCFIGLFCSFLPKNMNLLFLSYSLPYGFGSSLIFNSSLVIVSLYFDKKRSIATGIVTAGQGIGILMFGPILQSLVVALGWRKAFLVLGGIMTLPSFLAITYSKNVKEAPESEMNVTNEHIPSLDVPLYRNPVFVVITISSCICMFGEYIPQVHAISHCNNLGISSDDGSKLYILYGLASSISRIITGLICNTFSVINPRWLYQGTELALGIAMILSTLATQYHVIAVYFFFYGFFEGIYVTTLNLHLLNCSNADRRPMAFGVSVGLNALFTASGPPVAGLMADKFGSYNTSFYMAGAVVITGSLVPTVLSFMKTAEQLPSRTRSICSNQDNELFFESSV